jgi:Lrp/AsnC family leucine-responsive transcriptional regulator
MELPAARIAEPSHDTVPAVADRRSVVVRGALSKMLRLQRIDRKILNVLQSNNQMTNVELAEAVGISPPACLRRVRRLREARVIQRDISLIDPQYGSRRMSVIVEVALERERPDLMQGFKRTVLDAKEVTQCYVVTGDADFILVLQVVDIEAYDDFVQRVFYSNPNIRKFRTLIVMNRVKFDTSIALDEGIEG